MSLQLTPNEILHGQNSFDVELLIQANYELRRQVLKYSSQVKIIKSRWHGSEGRILLIYMF